MSSRPTTLYNGLESNRWIWMDFYPSNNTLLSDFPHWISPYNNDIDYMAPSEYGISHNTQFPKLVLQSLQSIESEDEPNDVYIWLIVSLPKCIILLQTPDRYEGEYKPKLSPNKSRLSKNIKVVQFCLLDTSHYVSTLQR
jgi:hypothetical protein